MTETQIGDFRAGATGKVIDDRGRSDRPYQIKLDNSRWPVWANEWQAEKIDEVKEEELENESKRRRTS
jgi:hypothetical protein